MNLFFAFLYFLAVFLSITVAFSPTAFASPSTFRRRHLQRKEWSVTHPVRFTHPCYMLILLGRRCLDNEEKYQYIAAVQCLQTRKATSRFPGSKTRFDDFQALHISLTQHVHLVVVYVVISISHRPD